MKHVVPWPPGNNEPPVKSMTYERKYSPPGDDPVPAGSVYRAVARFIEKQQKKHGRAHVSILNIQGDETFATVYYQVFPPREENK